MVEQADSMLALLRVPAPTCGRPCFGIETMIQRLAGNLASGQRLYRTDRQGPASLAAERAWRTPRASPALPLWCLRPGLP